MSRSDFTYRFRRNPWPWLIGVLVLSLTIMWLREYRFYAKASSFRVTHQQTPPPSSENSDPRTAFIASARDTPRLTILPDPFGNLFSLELPDPAAAAVPNLITGNFSVRSFNLDGTYARSLIIFSDMELSYEEYAPATDLILPATYFILFLAFGIMWIRNARRHRQSSS